LLEREPNASQGCQGWMDEKDCKPREGCWNASQTRARDARDARDEKDWKPREGCWNASQTRARDARDGWMKKIGSQGIVVGTRAKRARDARMKKIGSQGTVGMHLGKRARDGWMKKIGSEPDIMLPYKRIRPYNQLKVKTYVLLK